MSETLENLAADFFKKFARCEFALKDGGLHRRDKTDAEPDWRSFALSIEDNLSEEELEKPELEKLKKAVEYILEHPPKKQVIENDRLKWRDANPSTNSRADLILILVRRVRNNLFHGGKFNSDWFNPDRSETLIKNSVTILDACFRAAISSVSDRYNAGENSARS
jgi:hypothetical protein